MDFFEAFLNHIGNYGCSLEEHALGKVKKLCVDLEKMYKEIEAVGYYADYDDSTRIAQIGIYFVDEAALGENSALWEILSYADAVHVLKPEGDELEGYDALRFDVNICC